MAKYIAPHLTDDQYDESKRLEVFQKRTRSWILDVAIRLSSEKETGIAVLILTVSVFEPMGAILLGRAADREHFSAAFAYVFPALTGAHDARQIGSEVYDMLRNGLFHEAFIKPGLTLTDLKEPIVVDGGVVYVDPRRFVAAVADGFDRFCCNIQSDTELGKRFNVYWEHKETVNLLPLEAKMRRSGELA